MRIGSPHSMQPPVISKRADSVQEGESGYGALTYALLRANKLRAEAELTTYDKTGQLKITDRPHTHSPSGHTRQQVALMLVRLDPVSTEDTIWLQQTDSALYDYTQDILSIHHFIHKTLESDDSTPHTRQDIIALLTPVLESLQGPAPEEETALWEALLELSCQYDRPEVRQALLEDAPVFKRSLTAEHVEEV